MDVRRDKTASLFLLPADEDALIAAITATHPSVEIIDRATVATISNPDLESVVRWDHSRIQDGVLHPGRWATTLDPWDKQAVWYANSLWRLLYRATSNRLIRRDPNTGEPHDVRDFRIGVHAAQAATDDGLLLRAGPLTLHPVVIEASRECLSVKELFACETPDQAAAVLDRDDLVDCSADWWMGAIASCNAGMISAESGFPDAERWTELLVTVLDMADSLAVLYRHDVLHRRMMACAAAMAYFGVSDGDPVRDPTLVFHWLITALGGSREAHLQRCRALPRISKDLPPLDLYRAVAWANSARGVLELLGDIGQHVIDPALRQDIAAWHSLAASTTVLPA